MSLSFWSIIGSISSFFNFCLILDHCITVLHTFLIWIITVNLFFYLVAGCRFHSLCWSWLLKAAIRTHVFNYLASGRPPEDIVCLPPWLRVCAHLVYAAVYDPGALGAGCKAGRHLYQPTRHLHWNVNNRHVNKNS